MTLVGPAYWVSVAMATAFHEFAHLTLAWANGVRVKRVGFGLQGPYIVREPGNLIQNTCISLAGPAINLVLALLFFQSFPTFAFVNGLLGALNLMPVSSSDGMRVYQLWKPKAGNSGVLHSYSKAETEVKIAS